MSMTYDHAVLWLVGIASNTKINYSFINVSFPPQKNPDRNRVSRKCASYRK